MPSAVQMSSPALLNCTIWSWASCTSDVENPEAVSVNTIRLLDAGVPGNRAIGVGADSIEDRELSQPASPWASARSTTAVRILLVILVPLVSQKGRDRGKKSENILTVALRTMGNRSTTAC